MAELVVIVFAAIVGGTGPTYRDWLARRRSRRDYPAARVTYLPSACCRPPDVVCPDPEHCAICQVAAEATSRT